MSASDCWAAGYTFGDGRRQTLIERWDGTAWTIVDSPDTSRTQHNSLTDVTCVSASDCWAVGYYSNGGVNRTLIERWDGTSWAIVDSPNNSTSAHPNILTAVTCVAASDCWAVGYYNNGAANQTLIEHWDGASWTIVASPNSSTQANALLGVTCVSASDCWAVGYYYSGTDGRTLIERWDGASWAIVDSPNTPSASPNALADVACTTASDCWAVGYAFTGNRWQTLIERWEGTAWALVDSPDASSTQDNGLAAVTCVSGSDCWAVGYYDNGSVNRTLIERWDGTSWAIVDSPNTTSTQDNTLAAVTCVSESECWAVGFYGGDQTLTARYAESARSDPRCEHRPRSCTTTAPKERSIASSDTPRRIRAGGSLN